MRTIPEAVEDIKSILNNIECTEECTGETLVDINELVDEILTISCSNATEIRNKSIDEFVKRYKESNITEKVYERIFKMVQFRESDFHAVTEYIDFQYFKLANKIAEQMKAGEQA